MVLPYLAMMVLAECLSYVWDSTLSSKPMIEHSVPKAGYGNIGVYHGALRPSSILVPDSNSQGCGHDVNLLNVLYIYIATHRDSSPSSSTSTSSSSWYIHFLHSFYVVLLINLYFLSYILYIIRRVHYCINVYAHLCYICPLDHF